MALRLETRRLVLRQPVAADAQRLTQLLNNFAVSGKLSRVPYPYRLADAQTWLAGWRPDKPPGRTGFCIELPGEGLIGNCGFDSDAHGTVVGYWLGEPFWNRGFMSEALAAILVWYFAQTDADHIDSGIFAFNKASRALQGKFGFVETAEGRKHCLARQEDLRHIQTRLTRARWDELQHGASAKEVT